MLADVLEQKKKEDQERQMKKQSKQLYVDQQQPQMP